jgi:hypothetical protein
MSVLYLNYSTLFCKKKKKKFSAPNTLMMWQAVIDLKNVGLTYEADNEELQVVSDADKKAAEKQIREDTTLQASDNTNQ